MSEYDNAQMVLEEWGAEHYAHVNWKTSVFVVNSFLMFGLGVNFYDNYYNMVKYSQHMRHVNPVEPDTSVFDKEWGWATAEISAWTNYSYAAMGIYGSNALLWILNHYYDGEGGDIHEAYYRSSQLNHYIGPASLMILFGRVFNAYNRTPDTDDYYGATYCDNGNCTGEPYFYMKQFTEDNMPADAFKFRMIKDEYQRDFAVAFISILLTTWIQAMSLGEVRNHFEACRARAELHEEMEYSEEMMDEDVEATEAEENSETWF